jgi:hypothetical protein
LVQEKYHGEKAFDKRKDNDDDDDDDNDNNNKLIIIKLMSSFLQFLIQNQNLETKSVSVNTAHRMTVY